LELLTDCKSEIPACLPTVSERRENRIKIKEQLMKQDNAVIPAPSVNPAKAGISDQVFVLHISDTLKQKLDSQKILEEEVSDVVSNLLRTGRYVINKTAGTKSGYRKLGYMTYWVEFREASGGEGEIELINAYSHRMSIEHEPVWNGNKIEEIDDKGDAH
jgi:hypothetical protein